MTIFRSDRVDDVVRLSNLDAVLLQTLVTLDGARQQCVRFVRDRLESTRDARIGRDAFPETQRRARGFVPIVAPFRRRQNDFVVPLDDFAAGGRPKVHR